MTATFKFIMTPYLKHNYAYLTYRKLHNNLRIHCLYASTNRMQAAKK